MKGLADCAVAGIEFLDHALYTLAKTCLIQVNGKDVLAAVESLEA